MYLPIFHSILIRINSSYLLASGAITQAYRHAGQGDLADSVWSFGLGCPARICVQGIYPFSPRLAAFVERTAKSKGLASTSANADDGEPVAVLYHNAVAPGR